MAYTEIKHRNDRKYFYRVVSVRKGKKVSKIRKYLGINLSKKELSLKEKKADKSLIEMNPKIKKSLNNSIKVKIRNILIKNKIKKAGIFGSYARGDYRKNSDIDILIEPPKGLGFGFAGIEIQLSNKLKKKVNLVSYKGLNPQLKSGILNEEVRII